MPNYYPLLFGVFLLLLLVLSGCVSKSHSPEKDLNESAHPKTQIDIRVSHLERDLLLLLEMPSEEAKIIARTTVQESGKLTQRYEVSSWPTFHNLLVNLGLKKRGLCCHWTEDLIEALSGLQLEDYRVIWAVSKHGSFWEHNSVAVINKNHKFASGIILDPWRNGGELFWGKISGDKYNWNPHPDYKGVGSVTCED